MPNLISKLSKLPEGTTITKTDVGWIVGVFGFTDIGTAQDHNIGTALDKFHAMMEESENEFE